MNTVAVLTSRRADVAERTLEALARCDGVRDWRVIVVANDATPEVEDVVDRFYREQDFDPFWTIPRRGGRHVSASWGVNSALSQGFSRAETVVYLEEDALPAPDALTYFATMVERYRDDPDVFCIGGWGHGKPGDDPYGVVRVPFFMPLGIALDRGRWEEWSAGWDWDYWARGLQALRGERSVIYPLVSRIQNLGRDRGTTPEGEAAHAEAFAGDLVLPPWHEQEAA